MASSDDLVITFFKLSSFVALVWLCTVHSFNTNAVAKTRINGIIKTAAKMITMPTAVPELSFVCNHAPATLQQTVTA
eukprot:CAMPEP_0202705224 /NCGR_PEP_ID=MMETSP1385-20130828/17810_1 /ASSEMBLY_ACC=CAM_ASM_000861 /TAXON_ID=933848 /ORGANISM="Elphidium margaritaceum" /LENGTH=76 /DNA_ID=CAMNT_0049363413 /DNA_START=80 /DNA_END=310 /DNA_ORIENTATION=-